MSEYLPHGPLRLDEYSHFVANSRVNAAHDNWADESADLISGEHLEFLTQHGPGALLLFPKELEIPHDEAWDSLRFHMADEMGDMLWFATDAASRIHTRLAEVCRDSLSNYVGQQIKTPETFADIQKLATEHAAEITVPNKLGLMYPESSTTHGRTSLDEHPNYVLHRVSHRLTRGLEQGKNDMSPPTATELESIHDVADSLGAYVLTLAFVAKDRLEINFEDVAKFNVAKLQNRAQYGKANDIHFDQSYVTR